MVSESLLVPEETSGIWRLERRQHGSHPMGRHLVQGPYVHLLRALPLAPHTVRPVEWTSHCLWDHTPRPVQKLSNHQHTTSPLQVRRPALERDPSSCQSVGWVDSHLTCVLSHSSALQPHPLIFFSRRQKKNVLHWKSHLSLQSVQSLENISSGGGRNGEQVKKQ